MRMLALVSGLLTSACSVVGVRTTEEPPYDTVGHVGEVEIRVYAPRLAAEVLVAGTETDARGAGFRKAAAYIFGANRGQAKIAMTAPVDQSQAKSETIAMTAPVDQAREADGQWRVRFFMPAGYTLATLPEPTDPAVHIVTVPAQTLAVLRYSGVATPTAVRDATARLTSALAGSAWHIAGTPFSWFYDPPWALPPLRRNEAVVAVTG